MTMGKTWFFSPLYQDLCAKQWRQYQRLKCNYLSNPFVFSLQRNVRMDSWQKKNKSPPVEQKWKAQIPQECLFFKFLWKEKQSKKRAIKSVNLKKNRFSNCFIDDEGNQKTDFADTEIWVFCGSKLQIWKSSFGYKHSNTVNLALAEWLQVGGFSFGSEDFSFESIFTFILTTYHWIKSLLWWGFPCSLF